MCCSSAQDRQSEGPPPTCQAGPGWMGGWMDVSMCRCVDASCGCGWCGWCGCRVCMDVDVLHTRTCACLSAYLPAFLSACLPILPTQGLGPMRSSGLVYIQTNTHTHCAVLYSTLTLRTCVYGKYVHGQAQRPHSTHVHRDLRIGSYIVLHRQLVPPASRGLRLPKCSARTATTPGRVFPCPSRRL